MNKDNISLQLNGAKNIFFGILRVIDGYFDIELPMYVYHYTSLDSFYSMVKTNSIRLHTIENFEDSSERSLSFEIEERIKGSITVNETGDTHDLSQLVNKELSNEHVFIQSNTTTLENKYLWREYANNGEGVCLKLSVKKYIEYLNSALPDFDLLPDYFKCCFVSYSSDWANEFMDKIFPEIQKNNEKLGNAGLIVWFFYIEYWKSLMKESVPYAEEMEVRFMVSDHYSLFLFMCNLLAKWGVFEGGNSEDLSRAFYSEYENRKRHIHDKLGLTSTAVSRYVSVPFDEIFESVTIGPNSSIDKREISIGTNYSVKKSQIGKSYIRL